MSAEPRDAPAPPAGDARQRFDLLHGLLRMRISLLDYAPGERLREEDLAAEFGVSRTPIRRVLGRLETEGLVKPVQGVGTIVTDVDIEALHQVYQLRMELAELIGKLSPVQPGPEGVDAFRTLLARCDHLIEEPNPREFAKVNMAFFHQLMTLTENQPLKETYERLYYQTTRIWLKSVPGMSLLDEVVIFRREVADILSAVEIGDLKAIGHIRRSHISMSFMRLRAKQAVRSPP